MYYIAGAVIIACIVLFFISKSRDGPVYRKGIMGILDRISSEILLVKEKITGRKSGGHLTDSGSPKGIKSSLEQLNPGDNITEKYREYVVRKLSLSLAVIIAGTVLAASLKYKSDSSAGEISDGTITREEAFYHPRKNILMKALGCTENIEPDITVKGFLPGDVILMCSDRTY